MQPIATISSCYPQRFGVPRQAGLVKSATATVDFQANRDNELAVRDLETFSHLWILFVFHKQNYTGFKPLVQPPIKIRVVGGDFLDGTPVLDIKPYLPFADSIDNATADWAGSAESALRVIWSDAAAQQLSQAEPDEGLNGLQLLIEETIAQDPRPAHERNKDGKAGQTWGVRVAHVDVKWQVRDAIAEIVSLVVV